MGEKDGPYQLDPWHHIVEINFPSELITKLDFVNNKYKVKNKLQTRSEVLWREHGTGVPYNSDKYPVWMTGVGLDCRGRRDDSVHPLKVEIGAAPLATRSAYLKNKIAAPTKENPGALDVFTKLNYTIIIEFDWFDRAMRERERATRQTPEYSDWVIEPTDILFRSAYVNSSGISNIAACYQAADFSYHYNPSFQRIEYGENDDTYWYYMGPVFDYWTLFYFFEFARDNSGSPERHYGADGYGAFWGYTDWPPGAAEAIEPYAFPNVGQLDSPLWTSNPFGQSYYDKIYIAEEWWDVQAVPKLAVFDTVQFRSSEHARVLPPSTADAFEGPYYGYFEDGHTANIGTSGTTSGLEQYPPGTSKWNDLYGRNRVAITITGNRMAISVNGGEVTAYDDVDSKFAMPRPLPEGSTFYPVADPAIPFAATPAGYWFQLGACAIYRCIWLKHTPVADSKLPWMSTIRTLPAANSPQWDTDMKPPAGI
jgi:hypothetical protein